MSFIESLTLCKLGDFACFFLSSAAFFSKLTFSQNSFRNTIRVSNGLDPDQDQYFVGPDLGPNCLQSLSADDISRQIVSGHVSLQPFLSSADFFQINIFKKFFQEYHQGVKRFGSRSGPTFCRS